MSMVDAANIPLILEDGEKGFLRAPVQRSVPQNPKTVFCSPECCMMGVEFLAKRASESPSGENPNFKQLSSHFRSDLFVCATCSLKLSIEESTGRDQSWVQS
ncbi:hypothetical protein NPIL_277721 [Nephila pilipes]|uniref:Uncharacterized protein n=1 Tax=Nephila pilipes TaxID=299642 RepID=A0A8X6MZD5_NEPPI|nr:hypothetical protein NPIL_277721 [Nephila pilipes]